MPSDPGLDRLIFVDIETLGLNPNSDPVVEIGFRIIETQTLKTIDDFEVQIWNSPSFDEKWKTASPVVREMHLKSGIYSEENGPHYKMSSLTPAEAAPEIYRFLEGHGVRGQTEPLCGSSVSFDRAMLRSQYPEVEGLFHYRNIDISSLKELCKRLNPSIYDQLEKVAPAKKLHRALPDLDDTIAEFKFYSQEFLIW